MEKVLIAYFTHQDTNIPILAKNIQQYTCGDIYEIKVKDEYPEKYCTYMKLAKEELFNDIYPPLKDIVDISQYDTIFVGFPVWWSTYPRAIGSFFKETKPYHQTIIPFSDEGLGHSITDLKKLCPCNEVLPGIGIKSDYVEHSCTYIHDYLKKMELANKQIAFD